MNLGAPRLALAGATFTCSAFLPLSGGAEASQSVFKTMVGRVSSGKPWVEEFGAKHLIHARHSLSQPELDLTPFEGKRLRIERGHLLPSDIYVVPSAPMVTGECR